MGVYQTGTYTHSIACTHKANETTAYVATLEEAIKVKEEIVQAINEWVLNGGFDKILKAEGETPTEYNYEVTDYYE